MIRNERKEETEVLRFRVEAGLNQVLVGPPPMLPVMFDTWGGSLFLWVQVGCGPGSEMGQSKLRYHIVGTGETIPPGSFPFASLTTGSGKVWHFFGAGYGGGGG